MQQQKKLEQMTEQEREERNHVKRRFIATEIIDTERNYVNQLTDIVEVCTQHPLPFFFASKKYSKREMVSSGERTALIPVSRIPFLFEGGGRLQNKGMPWPALFNLQEFLLKGA